MAPIAHGGGMHWYESIIYLIPIVGFGLWLGITYIQDRRRGGAAADEDHPESQNGGLNRAERRAAERRARKEKPR